MKSVDIIFKIFLVLIGLASGVWQIIEGNIIRGIIIILSGVILACIIGLYKYWFPVVWSVISPPYPRWDKLAWLHLSLRWYDLRFVRKIRKHIKKANISYLQPIPESFKQWGILLNLWNRKIKNPRLNIKNKIRWSLLSDFYLNQEQLDIKKNKFATELDLYAKSILLNLYITVDPLGLVNLVENSSKPPSRMLWVITKMLPTDWPLCTETCSQDKDPRCLSGNVLRKDEEKFLKNYMRSLKACAGLKSADGGDIIFCRHILVANSRKLGFKSKEELDKSLTNHRIEYFQGLHRDIDGMLFGKSYSILLEDHIDKSWPEILNDSVFYGYRHKGSDYINWEWAICTTYTPEHPTILLHIYDLKKGKEKLENELDSLCQALGIHDDKFNKFIKWIEEKRDIIQENNRGL